MPVHLFVNPAAAAGTATARVAEVLVTFRGLGRRVEMHNPPSAEISRNEMRDLAESGVDRIVVVGGDGIVHLAANALVGTDTILGIVAAGTGNDAVLALDLPDDVEPACRAAMGDASPIDLIESDAGGVVVTVATLGFSVDVNERANAMKYPRGASRYTLSTLLELPRVEVSDLTLTIDGEVHDVTSTLVAVANTKFFGGGMKIAPGADPHDGLLDVVVVGSAGKATFARLLPMVFSGRHVKNKHVSVYRAKTVEITGPALNVSADGEPFGQVPVTFTALPKALLVAGA